MSEDGCICVVSLIVAMLRDRCCGVRGVDWLASYGGITLITIFHLLGRVTLAIMFHMLGR